MQMHKICVTKSFWTKTRRLGERKRKGKDVYVVARVESGLELSQLNSSPQVWG